MSNPQQVSMVPAVCSECGKRYRIPDSAHTYACKSCGSALAVIGQPESHEVESRPSEVRGKERATRVRAFDIRRISFGSLVGLGARIGIAGGAPVAVCALIASLLGANVEVTVVVVRVTGVLGGLVGLLWIPLLSGFMVALMAALAYWPLTWWMTHAAGLRLRLAFNEQPNAGPVNA